MADGLAAIGLGLLSTLDLEAASRELRMRRSLLVCLDAFLYLFVSFIFPEQCQQQQRILQLQDELERYQQLVPDHQLGTQHSSTATNATPTNAASGTELYASNTSDTADRSAGAAATMMKPQPMQQPLMQQHIQDQNQHSPNQPLSEQDPF